VTSLTNQDYQDVLKVITCSDFSLDPRHIREQIISTTQKIFYSKAAIFFLCNNKHTGLDFSDVVSIDIDKRWLQRYKEYYWRLDPIYRAAFNETYAAFRTFDVISQFQWTKLEYYNEFCKPQRYGEELVICLRLGNKLLGKIVLLKIRRNFDKKDVFKASLMAPHITTSLHNAILFSQINNEKQILNDIIDSKNEGLLLLDSMLQPVFLNRKCKEICLQLLSQETERSEKKESDDVLIPSEIARDCLNIQKSVSNKKTTTVLPQQRIISSDNGRRFSINYSMIQRSNGQQFLINLRDTSEINRSSELNLKKQYNLTNREIDIIHYLDNGLTNKEIADKLFISQFTVETHLKNIYEKTEVRNRIELANRIHFI
jgi:DNA-binding CsgD family transcriptional regulator